MSTTMLTLCNNYKAIGSFVFIALFIASPISFNGNDSFAYVFDGMRIVPHFPVIFPAFFSALNSIFKHIEHVMLIYFTITALLSIISINFYFSALSNKLNPLGIAFAMVVPILMGIYTKGLYAEGISMPFQLIVITLLIRILYKSDFEKRHYIYLMLSLLILIGLRRVNIIFIASVPLFLILASLFSKNKPKVSIPITIIIGVVCFSIYIPINNYCLVKYNQGYSMQSVGLNGTWRILKVLQQNQINKQSILNNWENDNQQNESIQIVSDILMTIDANSYVENTDILQQTANTLEPNPEKQNEKTYSKARQILTEAYYSFLIQETNLVLESVRKDIIYFMNSTNLIKELAKINDLTKKNIINYVDNRANELSDGDKSYFIKAANQKPILDIFQIIIDFLLKLISWSVFLSFPFYFIGSYRGKTSSTLYLTVWVLNLISILAILISTYAISRYTTTIVISSLAIFPILVDDLSNNISEIINRFNKASSTGL